MARVLQLCMFQIRLVVMLWLTLFARKLFKVSSSTLWRCMFYGKSSYTAGIGIQGTLMTHISILSHTHICGANRP